MLNIFFLQKTGFVYCKSIPIGRYFWFPFLNQKRASFYIPVYKGFPNIYTGEILLLFLNVLLDCGHVFFKGINPFWGNIALG